eukprot:scaffold62249_cov38-Prasinocladus_malaysianus.AAC.1
MSGRGEAVAQSPSSEVSRQTLEHLQHQVRCDTCSRSLPSSFKMGQQCQRLKPWSTVANACLATIKAVA